MDFTEWMREVNVAVDTISGLSVYDLPNCTFRDWFDDEVSADDAAQRALENAGFDA